MLAFNLTIKFDTEEERDLALDKLANKKVLPKNKVARQKSRLSNSIKKLG